MPKLPPIPPWLVERLKSPMATAAALALGVKVGQETYRVASGDISVEEFKKRASLHFGTLTGSLVGAVAGAAVGRLVPGVGALMGAFGGGMVGQLAGQHASRKGADRLGARPNPGAPDAQDTLPEEDDIQLELALHPLELPRRDL
jgi:phage tail tape-measure protein